MYFGPEIRGAKDLKPQKKSMGDLWKLWPSSTDQFLYMLVITVLG